MKATALESNASDKWEKFLYTRTGDIILGNVSSKKSWEENNNAQLIVPV